MPFKNSMLAGVFSAGVLSLVFISTGVAQDRLEPSNGWYFGFSTPLSLIMGGFSGGKALVGPQGTIYVPDIDPGPGVGITVGAREDNLAFEFSYIRSFHRAKSTVGSGDVTLNLMNFDLKFFSRTNEKTQPFILVGVNIPRLFVENASVSSTAAGRAKFSGFGGNLGGGVVFYYTPRISFSLGVTYRMIRYVSVTGLGDGPRDIGSFSGDTFSLSPKIMYSF